MLPEAGPPRRRRVPAANLSTSSSAASSPAVLPTSNNTRENNRQNNNRPLPASYASPAQQRQPLCAPGAGRGGGFPISSESESEVEPATPAKSEASSIPEEPSPVAKVDARRLGALIEVSHACTAGLKTALTRLDAERAAGREALAEARKREEKLRLDLARRDATDPTKRRVADDDAAPSDTPPHHPAPKPGGRPGRWSFSPTEDEEEQWLQQAQESDTPPHEPDLAEALARRRARSRALSRWAQYNDQATLLTLTSKLALHSSQHRAAAAGGSAYCRPLQPTRRRRSCTGRRRSVSRLPRRATMAEAQRASTCTFSWSGRPTPRRSAAERMRRAACG